MIQRKENESRLEYLARVAIALIRDNPIIAEHEIDYDWTTCDASCLADDLDSELGSPED